MSLNKTQQKTCLLLFKCYFQINVILKPFETALKIFQIQLCDSYALLRIKYGETILKFIHVKETQNDCRFSI
jgi:hypothetical protein